MGRQIGVVNIMYGAHLEWVVEVCNVCDVFGKSRDCKCMVWSVKGCKVDGDDRNPKLYVCGKNAP